MLSNRPEFHIADLAAVTLGATPFSIYVTYPADEIEFLITDSGARVAIVEQAFLPVILEARQNLPELEHVIVVDGDGARGRPGARRGGGLRPRLRRRGRRAQVTGDDLHAHLHLRDHRPPQGRAAHPSRGHVHRAGGARGDRVPGGLAGDLVAAVGPHRRADGPPLHPGHLRRHRHLRPQSPRGPVLPARQVRPNWFFAVPRIWEKLKAGLEAMQAAQPEEQRRPVQEALAAATERVRLRQQGKPVPAELEAPVAKADEELFSKLREMLGLDQLVAVNVGAAPTPVEVRRVLPRDRDRAGRAVGHVRDVRHRHLQPARPGQDRHAWARRPPASSSSSPTTARSCAAASS